ncbi:related to EMC1-member of a transmembrane complex required for efficient folding of proteins in the ER [Sporisorium reilianum f. sp. reilianum]|uniref:ER membrane protein complex subunit 1 n=1 Tax=Sporisorium reilianum f. sp. reilianum TaxID=72559 RepID=A0A2N8UMT2_9BASI|nr:related to EMC1-member of a transmembrane complex required for efficient folding of proteins in the ER [Sporisorium reilianum f. sp. reilianum]
MRAQPTSSSRRSGLNRFAAFALLASLLALLLGAHSASALSKAEAGKIDWHVPRMGVPHSSNDSATPYLSPRFHRIIKPDADIKDKAQTAVFVATESNTVGALNPRNGAIVWRQILAQHDQLLLHKQFGEVALAISGNGGANVRLYHAFTGFLIWESAQHSIRDGLLPEPGFPATDAVFLTDKAKADVPPDVVVLSNARTVRRLDGAFGAQVWKWEPQQDISRYSVIRVVANKDKIYVVSLQRNTNSVYNSLSVATLSAHTGELLTTHEIASGLNTAADVVILPWNQLPNLPATASPGSWVAWLNKDGTVRAAPLDPPSKRFAQPQVIYAKRSDSIFTGLVDVGLSNKGLFIGRRSDGLAEVLKVSADAKFTSFWEFEEDAHDAVYAGTYDRQGRAYLQRIFFSRSQHLLNLHFLWADANNGGEGQVSGFSFQWDHDMHGNVHAATFEASQIGQYQLATRTVLVTSSGSMRLLLEDQHQWILEEGLTQTTHAAFVDLPEKKLTTISGGAASLDHEGFVKRLVRHTLSLKDLPQYTIAFVTRFATGSYGSLEQLGLASSGSAGAAASSSAAAAATTTMVKEGSKPARKKQEQEKKPTSLAPRVADANTTSSLFRDPFGFRKVVVVATAKGKLYALDTIAKDTVVWEKSLVGYGEGEGESEPKVNIKLMQTVRELSTDGKSPLLAIVAEVELQPGLFTTRVFELNPLTGEFLNDASSGQAVFVGRCQDAFLLPQSVEDPVERQQSLGLVDQHNNLFLYPDTLAVAERFAPLSDRYYFSVQKPATSTTASARFVGYTVERGVSSIHKSKQVWSWTVPAGEQVVEVLQAPSKDVIASYGRVLGDRSTLYKYLNPHASLIVTKSPGENQAHLYLLDTVTGSVLYELQLDEVDLAQPVRAHLVENWIAATYSVRNADEGLSTRIVTVELYDQPEQSADEQAVNKKAAHRRLSASWSGLTGNFSSFTGDSSSSNEGGSDVQSVLPLAFSHTFLYSGGTVHALAATTTKFGISLKNLVLATDRESLVSLPRKLLDPRRPTAKPTKSEAEEYLIPYAPLIPEDPKWVLNHHFPAAGIQHIATGAALLESTSTVYAYGLDTFVTRTSPSGQFDVLQESFNKPQLLLTLAILSVGIVVTRPMVRNKALSLRW